MIFGSLLKWTLDAFSSIGHIPLPILFSDQFMKEFTSFKEWEEMMEVSQQKVVTIKDFERAEEFWNPLIQSSTQFSSWKEMKEEAEAYYFKQRPYGPFPMV
ncbi:hypothetical protein RYX56_12955 [Alkalihalophilus lindianensis]|uniref:Uncharacterized protein n=1 Tax=Alkalihalophilus lindianensis TaxID=1630542 RepID=A0ABU3XBK7_9BACI|nr:hypothetical protein [Alkalihalophilus lindianensis]MDV2685265.1 hypothetical protein [Alkalihalophilus lindianensis]